MVGFRWSPFKINQTKGTDSKKDTPIYIANLMINILSELIQPKYSPMGNVLEYESVSK